MRDVPSLIGATLRTIAPMARPYGGQMAKQTEHLLDRPRLRDWIVYLWALGITAGVTTALGDYRTDANVVTDSAFWMDLAFAIGVQSFLFMVLPAWLRRSLRRRSASRQRTRTRV